MARPTYLVKVPEVVANLKDRGMLQIDGDEQTPAMFVARVALIAVGSAYKAIDSDTRNGIDLNTAWKIYAGMKVNGVTVDFGDGERPIEWSDVVEELEEDG